MSDFVKNFDYDFLNDFDDLDDVTLSQVLDRYEISENLDLGLEDYSFGSFNVELLKEGPEPTENTKSRFGPPVDSEYIQDFIKSKENRNTRKNTNWAKRAWDEWTKSRGDVPALLTMNDLQMNHYLSCFVIECRRQDGTEYPGNSLYQLVSGLLRYLRENGVIIMNYLNTGDLRFQGFRKTLDARMKDLTSRGIGGRKKEADPISPENENVLWEKEQLGGKSSQSLLNTVFYYNCKLFGLRGMDEHRALCGEQFVLGADELGTLIEFQGRTSNNFAGGLNQRKIQPKCMKHYSEARSDRSLYDLYELYLEKVGKMGTIYRRPIQGKEMKFSSQVVGVNKLSTIVKTMCTKAGIQWNFSNHSGKRTCATSLFQSGVDEQLIMQRTGHRSTAVRDYKRTSSVQEKEISPLLEPPSKHCKMSFQDALSVFGASDTNEIKTEITVTSKSNELNLNNCTVTINLK
ncbi:zinc finger MYM-type protein 2-like [Pecten maximus]|uniref:zinc finger MYM-type protein 2-like n=1 Tax=Pecten maximus TaxID=6579 RepID=UPI001459159E|nr:zinc finger MYM-type protein 2-like [Pecten maximus]